MSQLGHLQTFAESKRMSALQLKSDIAGFYEHTSLNHDDAGQGLGPARRRCSVSSC
jgi:hypothetical protein